MTTWNPGEGVLVEIGGLTIERRNSASVTTAPASCPTEFRNADGLVVLRAENNGDLLTLRSMIDLLLTLGDGGAR